MTPHGLWPPLEWIDETPPRAGMPESAVAPADAGAAPGVSVLPPAIAELIDRRVAARQALATLAPAVGAIVATHYPEPGNRRLQILLCRELRNEWMGYLVGAEPDYASHWDVLLTPDDAPFDPEAAMVQTWNPVRLPLGNETSVVARLSAERLAAVEAVADEFRRQIIAPLPPQPGRVYPRQTEAGHAVLTGTPLGGVDDPRRLYQSLYIGYARAAEAASLRFAPPQPQPAPEPAPEATLGDLISPSHSRRAPTLRRSGWAVLVLAVAGALLVGGWLAGLLREPAPRQEFELTRGVLPRPASADFRIVVNPQAEFGAVVALLQKQGCRIVAGPSPSGELWLALEPTADREETRQQLSASPLIDDVALLPPTVSGSK